MKCSFTFSHAKSNFAHASGPKFLWLLGQWLVIISLLRLEILLKILEQMHVSDTNLLEILLKILEQMQLFQIEFLDSLTSSLNNISMPISTRTPC